MPAVSRQRQARHTQTPYVRQKRNSKLVDDEVTLKTTESTGLLAAAASRFLHLVNWAFSSADDLSDKARTSASKIVRRDPPQRSNTSQLEDGVLGKATARSDSLLSADLVPHYLGKTPRAVRVRSQQGGDTGKPSFELPMFDSSRFKIPALPTPQQEERMVQKEDFKNLGPNQRGKSLKALEISNVTQTRHDNEILGWLASQKLQPKDLTMHKSLDELQIEDPDKLRKILRDDGFFRRRGLKPPAEMQELGQPQAKDSDRIEQHKGRSTQSIRSAISLDHSQSERSASTLKGQLINSRNWQTHSSTGILSAWRDICEHQEVRVQTQSLSLPQVRQRSKSRTTSFASSQREPAIWHANLSYTNEPVTQENNSSTESRTQLAQVDDKYWGTVRAFPAPSKEVKTPSLLKHDHATQPPIQKHRRSHSRQLSLARRPRKTSDYAAARSPRVSRQTTPNSVKSSRHSSKKPHDPRNGDNQDVDSRNEKVVAKEKPVMVDSQVQTVDINTSLPVRPTEYVAASEEHRVISKERRKRPGCFSALDEDMEDLFGPYSDIPLKKARLHDDVAEFAYPRVPLLREDEEVKAFRARQAEEEAKSSAEQDKDVQTNDSTTLLEPDSSGKTNIDLRHVDAVNQTEGGFNLRVTANSSNNPNRTSGEAKPLISHQTFAAPSFVFGATAAQPAANNDLQPKDTGLLAGEYKSLPKFDFNPPASTEESKTDAYPRSKPLSASPVFSFGGPGIKLDEMPINQEAAKGTPELAQPSIGFKFGTTDTSKEKPSADFTFGSTILGNFAANNDQGNVATKDKTVLDTITTAPAFGLEKSTIVPAKFSFGQPVGPQAPSSETTFGSPAPGPSRGMGFQFGTQQSGETEKKSSGRLTNSTAAIPETTVRPLDTTKASTQSKDSQFVFGNAIPEPTTMHNSAATTSGFNFGATVIPSTSSGFVFDKNPDKATTFVFGSSTPAAKSLEHTTNPSFPAVKEPDSKPTGNSGVSSFGQSQNVAKPETVANQALPVNAALNTTSSVPKFNFAPETGPIQAIPAVSTSNTTSDVPKFNFTGAPTTTGNSNAFAASTTPTVTNSSRPMPNSTDQSQSTSILGQPPPSTFSQSTNAGMIGNVAGSGFNFGTSSAVPSGPFGTTTSNGPVTSFSAPTVAPAAVSFGATNTNTPHNLLGANNSGQSSAFGFGAPSENNAGPANPTPFAFGAQAAGSSMFGAAQNPVAPSFGSQSNVQASQPQPFVFGSQVNTAPSSGFASPALNSPSLQSATVPGSPNPFEFNAGGQAQGQGGARKIAQPRSRRARGGGSNR